MWELYQNKTPQLNEVFCVGGSLNATLELYNNITENLEAMQKWNEEVRAFMALERTESAFLVTL